MRVLPSSIVSLLLISAAHLAVAQQTQVKVEVAPEFITVGDRVEAKLTLVWDGGTPASQPRFPAWQETWGDAEVLAAGEIEAFKYPSGRWVYSQTVVLTAFDEFDRVPEAIEALLAGRISP